MLDTNLDLNEKLIPEMNIALLQIQKLVNPDGGRTFINMSDLENVSREALTELENHGFIHTFGNSLYALGEPCPGQPTRCININPGKGQGRCSFIKYCFFQTIT